VAALIVLAVVVVLVLVTLARTIRIIPQARAGVVERLGRYSRTLNPGLAIVVPFVDRIRDTVDMREQVVSFPPQPVITEDNLVVNIDSVIYFQVTDPRAATYEIASFVSAIDLLTVTTLRNVIGGLTLEETLTSRDSINDQLRGTLDDATGKWGIRVHRVELKAIDPPATVKDTMEKQMRADREKRAAILQAEGVKQSQILAAEGERQSAILKAEGERQAAMLRAEGQAKAIETVFRCGSQAARLPVPPDPAADRAGGVEQGLDHPQRVHAGDRPARWRARAAAAHRRKRDLDCRKSSESPQSLLQDGIAPFRPSGSPGCRR
jgi:regulator of protease activity HflC (stomatin/prohibitin superfamily)